MNKRKIVILTGAGISAESGLQTFRGNDGLWEGYRVEEVATPEAWNSNQDLVQRFYNIRRKACREAQPNKAHLALAELENSNDVYIITQNIDDLHERAGSKNILHLHGEIMKSQSTKNAQLVYPIKGDELNRGDLCELGSQLRPHVVWFGEGVPNISKAIELVRQAEILIIIGTSLQVYPAAGLLDEAKTDCRIIFIDPNADKIVKKNRVEVIAEKATIGVETLIKDIQNNIL